jgi:hypothetical protein
VNVPARRFWLLCIAALLSITAVLGITSVLWTGLGQAGGRVLESTVAADVASFLGLCCAGGAKSATHRAVQVIGVISAGLGLAGVLSVIWWNSPAIGPLDAMARATAVVGIVAAAAAHASLVLPRSSDSRLARTVATATALCTGAAAELVANVFVFPTFAPGAPYLKAVAVIVILDALGTMVVLLLNRLRSRAFEGSS